MSSKIHRAPLALARDGTVLLNVAMFDVPKTIDKIFELALRERGAIFVAIAVNARELERLRDEIDDTISQAAFGVVGARQAKQRRGGK